MNALLIDNRRARRIFMRRHALSDPPTPKQNDSALLALIERLGFVQVDSIRTVERAHHMILFARNQTYRPAALHRLIERERTLFENWTHDASVIPTRFFPYWRTAMMEIAPKIAAEWEKRGRVGFREQEEKVLAEIARNGPRLSREIGESEPRSSGGWWEWNPSKTTLEWLWRSGKLCITQREGFQKVYDLTQNVIPAQHRGPPPDRMALIDWVCGAALDRLGFATSGEIAAFWDLITPAEAKGWCAAQNSLIEVAVEGADGAPRTHMARRSLLEEDTKPPPTRIRALSPFDPLIRDRKRAKRLFGFDYTIEVFTPAAKRRYGYYVFPLLEGDRLIGRIDMRADRARDELVVTGLWLEPGVRPGVGRIRRLEAELERQRRFAGVSGLRIEDGWIRT